ncbi:MAG TPA: hypothetical protein PK977_09755, partial [Chitinophagaceae bacterium]|nr:hypothetical protein [Chitinophagaceae bacterium]
TRLPQTPVNHLGQILCDADLFYIGKDGYAANAEKLFQEFKYRGFVKTEAEWQLMQVEFLSNHKFFTKSAISELEAAKQQIIKELTSGVEHSLASHHEDSAGQLIQDLVL